MHQNQTQPFLCTDKKSVFEARIRVIKKEKDAAEKKSKLPHAAAERAKDLGANVSGSSDGESIYDI